MAILVECPCAEVRIAEKSCWKIFWQRVVPTVVVALERLCDNCNTIGVRHSHWMGCRN